VVGEVVIVVVPAIPDAFLGVLASFPIILDESVLAFLSLCWPFAIVVAFEQQSRHQQVEDSEGDSLLVPD
jgi:hypothetical protein